MSNRKLGIMRAPTIAAVVAAPTQSRRARGTEMNAIGVNLVAAARAIATGSALVPIPQTRPATSNGSTFPSQAASARIGAISSASTSPATDRERRDGSSARTDAANNEPIQTVVTTTLGANVSGTQG